MNSRTIKKFSRKQAGKWLAFSVSAIILFIWVIPFLLMLNSSFKSRADVIIGKMYQLPKAFHLSNYTDAANAMDITESLFVSILVTVVSNLSIIFFASITAWMLVRTKNLFSQIIFYLILITMIIPFQAIMLPLMSVMNKFGLLNIFGLIFMYTGFGMGISVFMMHGFLKSIPLALEEAAMVEGLNPFMIYFKVVLPLLKPIIVTVVVLNTMWIWNDFLLPYLVHITNPNSPTTLPVNLQNNLIGTYGAQIEKLMAGLTIMIIPAIIFFIVAQKHIISGVTNGAVK